MRALLSCLLAIAVGALTLGWWTDGGTVLTAEAARRGAAQRGQLSVGRFAVETTHRKWESIPSPAGKIQVIEFIYTSCPTLCQAGGVDMYRLANRLEAGGLASRAQLISVSFDPSHDDIERLRSYGDRFRADGKVWTIARASTPELDGMLRDFGVIVIPDRYGGYVHNIALHVVTPDGRLAGIYDSNDIDTVFSAIKDLAS
jgi:protein SCO1/2